MLAAQYRLMIRTDRTKAEQRGKNDAIVIDPYTDEQIAEIDAVVGGGTGEPSRQRTALVGGRARKVTRSDRW